MHQLQADFYNLCTRLQDDTTTNGALFHSLVNLCETLEGLHLDDGLDLSTNGKIESLDGVLAVSDV